LLSVEMSCPNAKHGCNEKISYIGKRKHEKECIHVPCYCPVSSCDFVASSDVLYKHFSDKHRDSQIKFSHGHSFPVSLKSNDQTIVFQEARYGKLFVLSNKTMQMGNAVNICGIGPNFYESEVMIYLLGLRRANWNYSLLVKMSNVCYFSKSFIGVPCDYFWFFWTSEARNLHNFHNPHGTYYLLFYS